MPYRINTMVTRNNNTDEKRISDVLLSYILPSYLWSCFILVSIKCNCLLTTEESDISYTELCSSFSSFRSRIAANSLQKMWKCKQIDRTPQSTKMWTWSGQKSTLDNLWNSQGFLQISRQMYLSAPHNISEDATHVHSQNLHRVQTFLGQIKGNHTYYISVRSIAFMSLNALTRV